MKSCFLFGHHECTSELQSEIEKVVTKHYSYYGVRYFYVGYHGLFDRIAASAIKNVKKRFTDIHLYLLLAYHPAEYPIEIPGGFDGTYYPPLQNVPRRFAIVQANRHMVDSCDTLICYVNHYGNPALSKRLDQKTDTRVTMQVSMIRTTKSFWKCKC